MSLTPSKARKRLADCREPFLIGVRHHSPALAAALPALLDAASPERIFLELPAELQQWIEWLGHPDLIAPVALSAVRGGDRDLWFYPFADFSPELVAVRWARAHRVPVIAFDRPVELREPLEEAADLFSPPGRETPPARWNSSQPGVLESVGGRIEAPTFEELWDRLVEDRVSASSGEEIRRAALLLGFAHRSDAGPSRSDVLREAFMRKRLDEVGREGSVALVGSFHAAALLPGGTVEAVPADGPGLEGRGVDVVTALVPYDFELLDSRSGYPAGIRDPMWRQRVLEAAGVSAASSGAAADTTLDELVCAVATEVARSMRRRGHVAGLPDVNETVRMARDLARLRGLPSPGRRELLESLESTLAQGELLGRGRVIAAALQEVMVGRRRGRLPKDAPRSGLVPHVFALLEELRLPGPDQMEPAELRLDPLRSPLDTRRHVALRRLEVTGVPYARPKEAMGLGGGETLTVSWTVAFTPATEARVSLAGLYGVTLAQAAEGALLAEERRLQREDKLGLEARLGLVEAAARCALPRLVREKLAAMRPILLAEAGMRDLVSAILFLSRLARGHVPGLSPSSLDADLSTDDLLAACVRAIDGLSGSDRIDDARALLELVRLMERTGDDSGESSEIPNPNVGHGRLLVALADLARNGSPLMQGAAGAAQVVMGHRSAEDFGRELGSWVYGDCGRPLAARLSGALTVASPLLAADPGFGAELVAAVEALPDEDFLSRLASLREGFETLSPAARQRLLEVLSERSGLTGSGLLLEDSPGALARYAAADAEGRRAAESLAQALGG